MSTEEQNRDDIKELYQLCNKTLGQVQAVQAQIDAAIKMQDYQAEELKTFKQELKETMDSRFKWYQDHEARMRDIEKWMAKSTAYWAMIAVVLSGAVAVAFEYVPKLLG